MDRIQASALTQNSGDCKHVLHDNPEDESNVGGNLHLGARGPRGIGAGVAVVVVVRVRVVVVIVDGVTGDVSARRI
jgi:hypothetical protein